MLAHETPTIVNVIKKRNILLINLFIVSFSVPEFFTIKKTIYVK